MLSHVSIGTNDIARARKFYEAVLSTLGCRIVMEHPGAVAFGRDYPEFWLGTAFDGKEATVGNGSHFGFNAESREEVDRFYAAALANGAKPDGEPGGREDYGEPYYGCFVRDLDGHKIEATFWDEALAKKLGMG
ncbi:MAG: VOC family protein [Rhizobiales bacterium]|nr:VOC family protein [Hyphomicrobiales bacterium]